MVGVTDDGARALLPAAAEEFGRRVHAVPADAWARGTPDEDWSVRDLVGHLVAEHLWVPPLLAGETVAEVGDRFDGDVVGDDPVGAWDRAIAASLNSWAQTADDQVVDLSAGPTPGTWPAVPAWTSASTRGWSPTSAPTSSRSRTPGVNRASSVPGSRSTPTIRRTSYWACWAAGHRLAAR